MTLTWEHCPTGGVLIVSKLKKKDKQNLTLMTPFGNVVSWPKIWLIILPWEHCPTGSVFIVAKFKQIQTKSNPNDSHLRTLSVGQNVVNDSPLGALSHWGVFIVAKLKQIQTKSNPNDSHLGTLSVGQNVVNDSPFGALSHWRRVYCSQIKTNTNKI